MVIVKCCCRQQNTNFIFLIDVKPRTMPFSHVINDQMSHSHFYAFHSICIHKNVQITYKKRHNSMEWLCVVHLPKFPKNFEWIVKFAFPFSLIHFNSLHTASKKKSRRLVEVAITVNSYPKNGNKFPFAKFNCVLSIRVFCDTHSSGFSINCQRERMWNANNIEEHRSYSLAFALTHIVNQNRCIWCENVIYVT